MCSSSSKAEPPRFEPAHLVLGLLAAALDAVQASTISK